MTTLPDGLTQFQHRQWNEKFQALRQKILSFEFTEEVN